MRSATVRRDVKPFVAGKQLCYNLLVERPRGKISTIADAAIAVVAQKIVQFVSIYVCQTLLEGECVMSNRWFGAVRFTHNTLRDEAS